MLLPPELLTLVFLTGLTAAYPEGDDILAATTALDSLAATASTIAPIAITTTPSSTEDSNGFAPAPAFPTDEPPPEAQPTEDIYPCDLPEPPDWCDQPGVVQPQLPTATGWDDWGDWNNENSGGGSGGAGILPTGALMKPQEQTPIVITTRTPTVVHIKTNFEPSATKDVNGGGQPQAPGHVPTGEYKEHQDSSPRPTTGQDTLRASGAGGDSMPQESPAQTTLEQPTAGPGPNSVGGHVTGSKQTTSSGNDLLDAIIREISNAKPDAQPAQASRSTLVVSGEHSASATDLTRTEQLILAQSGVISRPTTLDGTDTVLVQTTIAAGPTIALGAATLSLTPGLSTIIRKGTGTTLIAIQTDSASQTIITISSSGAAITATITDAPATVTVPRTGFEASITGDAGRGVDITASIQGAPTTSSRAVASHMKVRMGGLSGFVLGALSLMTAC
ncbi:hypothetical protein EKO04_003159 [Ascochyta lentis]|uniref:Uncharacterized protein n=1 Tax=Ascochyta lentis TaxID=205686 RepID=A0A8H7JB30_9PLEO|nr:hypothetical protein EKO04_003159 [Ascochyta lentis]